ncbi:MAG: aminoacyl-tRNA hydrolase [Chloroflexi bacterium]|nr:aminoacyl-tRNA hydrolase [Chloroflexota bacterium]
MAEGRDEASPGSSAGRVEFGVIGLGNPEPGYARHRHNIGFQVVDLLAARYGIVLTQRKARSRVGMGSIEGHRVALIQPLTWMNESGKAVTALQAWLALPPNRLLIIYDDLDLPLARVRLRAGGAAGGHHGLESIFRETGQRDFPRLRVGIGRPASRDGVIDFVLSPFAPEEEPAIAEARTKAVEAVGLWILTGVQEAMNSVNGSAPDTQG